MHGAQVGSGTNGVPRRVPVGQMMQLEEPGKEICPRGHLVHLKAPPVENVSWKHG